MLHTAIIWQSGFNQLSHILWHFNHQFRIKEVGLIEWRKGDIVNQLNKIYPNRTFHPNSAKVKEIKGNSLIYLIMQVDAHQQHLPAKLKQEFRLQLQANVFHISDNQHDGYYNYAAITGKSKSEFHTLNLAKDVVVIAHPKSIISVLSFPRYLHLGQVFECLNKHIPYVILRNWEDFHQDKLNTDHLDVDLLVSDYFTASTLLAAHQIDEHPSRVRNIIPIGENIIAFDIRSIGDGYYDTTWQQDMLHTRKKQSNFYVLSPEHHFYSLLYHTLYHKKTILPDYYQKLRYLAKKLKINIPDVNFNGFERILTKFMHDHKYKITKPVDPSVKVEPSKLNRVLQPIAGKFSFLKKLISRKRIIFLSNSKVNHLTSSSSARIITQNVFSTRHHIIKRADKNHRFLLRNEYAHLIALKNTQITPDPVAYIKDQNFDYLVTSKIKGKDLAKLLFVPKMYQPNFTQTLRRIKKILKHHQIIHHDIRPHNLIVLQGKAKIIDFSYASSPLSQPAPKSIQEKFIFHTNMAKIGGAWYQNNLSIEEQDAHAIDQIINIYTKSPTIAHLIKSLPHFIKLNLKRYTQYK